MDYSKLSDFEINKLVASAQSLLVNDEQCASLKVKSSSVLVNDIVSLFEFNPCNNPLDAWPIIIENEISISKLKCELYWIADFRDFYFRDTNKLRAAMIVYLMMQEQ